VTKKLARPKAKRVTRRGKPQINEEEEQILRQAAIYCLRSFPMLWTVGDIREERTDNGIRRWVIAVHLRYPTGHEGYLGDLQFDGKELVLLTDREVMRERARKIAADPERMRLWNEYKASLLPTAKR
jgi:hypothetical protein